MYNSETSFIRHLILPYCIGKGCDIGAAGDRIKKENCHYIGDPQGYAHCGNDPIDIPCRINMEAPHRTIPIADQTYDYVYSSHLIEDFWPTEPILKEHIRILKNGGNLILAFPDQAKYLQYCSANKTMPNGNHRVDQMGLNYMLGELKTLLYDGIKAEVLFTSNCDVTYNVIVVAKIDRTHVSLTTKMVGKFNMFCQESATKNSIWEFTGDGRAIQDGKQMGQWRVADGKFIIKYRETLYNSAVLEFVGNTLVGINQHKNGAVFNWVLEPQMLSPKK